MYLEGAEPAPLYLANTGLHTRSPVFETSQREASCDAWKALKQCPENDVGITIILLTGNAPSSFPNNWPTCDWLWPVDMEFSKNTNWKKHCEKNQRRVLSAGRWTAAFSQRPARKHCAVSGCNYSYLHFSTYSSNNKMSSQSDLTRNNFSGLYVSRLICYNRKKTSTNNWTQRLVLSDIWTLIFRERTVYRRLLPLLIRKFSYRQS